MDEGVIVVETDRIAVVFQIHVEPVFPAHPHEIVFRIHGKREVMIPHQLIHDDRIQLRIIADLLIGQVIRAILKIEGHVFFKIRVHISQIERIRSLFKSGIRPDRQRTGRAGKHGGGAHN